MSTPIRVAHVIQNLNFGGMERVLHSLAQALPAHGFEVHVVVLQYTGQFAQGLEQVAQIHQVPPMGKLSLFRPTALADTLRQINPAIMHSHSGVWLKAARAARLAGVPATVHTEHGRPDNISWSDRWLDRQASRLTGTVIAVSDALAEKMRQQVMHDPSRVRVIINGVDLERMKPTTDRATLRQELGLPIDAPVVGSIGRLEPVKNYQLAVTALAQLQQQRGAATPWLVLAGDGSERQSLLALATTLGVQDRVRFLGWRDDAHRIYSAYDIFTLPSRSEGTSISLLEAMSASVCPVVTDVGGNRAVLGPALEQLLVPDNDPAALAAGWARQLDDTASRQRLAAVARKRVEDHFSLQHMVAEHVRLYREIAPAGKRN